MHALLDSEAKVWIHQGPWLVGSESRIALCALLDGNGTFILPILANKDWLFWEAWRRLGNHGSMSKVGSSVCEEIRWVKVSNLIEVGKSTSWATPNRAEEKYRNMYADRHFFDASALIFDLLSGEDVVCGRRPDSLFSRATGRGDPSPAHSAARRPRGAATCRRPRRSSPESGYRSPARARRPAGLREDWCRR